MSGFNYIEDEWEDKPPDYIIKKNSKYDGYDINPLLSHVVLSEKFVTSNELFEYPPDKKIGTGKVGYYNNDKPYIKAISGIKKYWYVESVNPSKYVANECKYSSSVYIPWYFVEKCFFNEKTKSNAREIFLRLKWMPFNEFEANSINIRNS